MHRNALLSVVVAAIIILASLASGYYVVSSAPTTQSSVTTGAALTDVNFGFAGPPDVTDTPEFPMYQIFAKQLGLNVHVQYFDTDVGVQQALITGKIDLGESGFQSVIQVDETNGNATGTFPVKVVGAYESTNDYAFVVKNDIKDFASLANQPIASGHLGVSSYIFCVDLLSKLGGLPPNQISCVPIGGTSARAQVLYAGKVVGTVLEPFDTVTALASGRFHILATVPQLYPNLLFNIISTSVTYGNAHPAVVQKMVESLILADRWAHNETQWINQVSLMFPGTNVTRAGAAWRIWMAMNMWNPYGGLNTNKLVESENFEIRAKQVRYFLQPQYWADLSYQNNAIQEIGNYTGPLLGYPDPNIPSMNVSIPGVDAINVFALNTVPIQLIVSTEELTEL